MNDNKRTKEEILDDIDFYKKCYESCMDAPMLGDRTILCDLKKIIDELYKQLYE